MSGVLAALIPATRLVRLSPIDLVIVVFYFVLVLAIGFYLKSPPTPRRIFF